VSHSVTSYAVSNFILLHRLLLLSDQRYLTHSRPNSSDVVLSINVQSFKFSAPATMATKLGRMQASIHRGTRCPAIIWVVPNNDRAPSVSDMHLEDNI